MSDFIKTIFDILVALGILAAMTGILLIPAYIAYRALKYLLEIKIFLRIFGLMLLGASLVYFVASLMHPEYGARNLASLKVMIAMSGMGLCALFSSREKDSCKLTNKTQ